jgi:hypothetical protein
LADDALGGVEEAGLFGFVGRSLTELHGVAEFEEPGEGSAMGGVQFRAAGDLGEEFAGGLVKDAEAITGLKVGAEDLGNLDGQLVGGKARMPFAQFCEPAEEFIRRNRRNGWGDRCGGLGRATACGWAWGSRARASA